MKNKMNTIARIKTAKGNSKVSQGHNSFVYEAANEFYNRLGPCNDIMFNQFNYGLANQIIEGRTRI